jgi:hypothetical protein
LKIHFGSSTIGSVAKVPLLRPLLLLLLLLLQYTFKLEMDGAWDFRFCFETLEQAQVDSGFMKPQALKHLLLLVFAILNSGTFALHSLLLYLVSLHQIVSIAAASFVLQCICLTIPLLLFSPCVSSCSAGMGSCLLLLKVCRQQQECSPGPAAARQLQQHLSKAARGALKHQELHEARTQMQAMHGARCRVSGLA